MESIRKDDNEEKEEVGPAAKKRKAGTDSYDAKCGYKGAQGAAAAATATTTAPVSRIKDVDRTLPPRTSFAPRRYWALWAKGYFDDEEDEAEMNGSVMNTNGADAEDNNVKGIRHEPHAKGGSDGNDNQGDVSRAMEDSAADPRRKRLLLLLRKWEEENELALHCQRVRDRIELCDQRIERNENNVEACLREADELFKERDEWTVLPRLFATPGWTTWERSADEAFFNDRIRPRLLAGDKEFAWAILNCNKPLPIEVQKTLWMDPTCLLRKDRDIMLASIDKGLDGERVKIMWSDDIANDKPLVQKCFAMCPQCLEISGGENDGDGALPPCHLEDVANLRAFAFSDHENARRCRKGGNRGNGIHTRFSPALFQDPALMADFVLAATKRNDDSVDCAEVEDDAADRPEDEDAADCSTEEEEGAEYSTDEDEGAEYSTDEDEGAEYSTDEDDDAEYSTDEGDDADAEYSTDEDDNAEYSTDEGDDADAEYSTDEDEDSEYSTEVGQDSGDCMEEEGDSDDRIEDKEAADDSTEVEEAAVDGTEEKEAAKDRTEQEGDAASTEYEDGAEDLNKEEVAAVDFAEVEEDADDRTDDAGADDRTEEEGWIRSVVEGAFPRRGKDDDDAATVLRQPLLDSEEFALRLARGLLDAAIPESQRHTCPVTYRGLSLRLRATPEVARAFVRLHPTNVLYVPPDLRSHDEIWGELWEVATTGVGGREGNNNNDNSSSNNNNDDDDDDDDDTSSLGSEAHSASADAPSCSKRIATKGLVLQLLEESNSKYWPEGALNDLAEVFPSLDPAIQQDRDVNLYMAVTCAVVPSTELRDRLASTWIRSRDFWIDLAVEHHCQHDLWTIVPAPKAVATDAAVVLAWARHAPACLAGSTTGGRVRWIANAVAKFPRLALLADRAVLLNWMPHFFKRTKMLFHDRIPRAVLHDKSLWLELLPSLDDDTYAGRHIPRRLRHDPDIVDAQLRCPVTKWKTFRRCYSELPTYPEDLKKRFAHRLVAAIESRRELDVYDRLYQLLAHFPDLLRIPEVAHAALCKEYSPESFVCEEVMEGADWANDPVCMLSLARRLPTGLRALGFFWYSCSEDLRNNKDFLLEVLSLDDPPCLEVRGELEDDYDIMCATYALRNARWSRVPRRREMDFIRTVRGRLQQYLSLEAFMAGIQSDKSCRPHEGPVPLTLLRQDGDTLKDFKRRMVELLGCVSHEEASVLRRVSLTFTMHGF